MDLSTVLYVYYLYVNLQKNVHIQGAGKITPIPKRVYKLNVQNILLTTHYADLGVPQL